MKAYMQYKWEEKIFPSYKKLCDWADEKGLFYTKNGFSRIKSTTVQMSFLQSDWEYLMVRKKPFKN